MLSRSLLATSSADVSKVNRDEVSFWLQITIELQPAHAESTFSSLAQLCFLMLMANLYKPLDRLQSEEKSSSFFSFYLFYLRKHPPTRYICVNSYVCVGIYNFF